MLAGILAGPARAWPGSRSRGCPTPIPETSRPHRHRVRPVRAAGLLHPGVLHLPLPGADPLRPRSRRVPGVQERRCSTTSSASSTRSRGTCPAGRRLRRLRPASRLCAQPTPANVWSTSTAAGALRAAGLDPADWDACAPGSSGERPPGRRREVRRLATDAMRSLLVNLRRIAARLRPRARAGTPTWCAWRAGSTRPRHDRAHALWAATFGLYPGPAPRLRRRRRRRSGAADRELVAHAGGRRPGHPAHERRAEGGGRSGARVDFSTAKASRLRRARAPAGASGGGAARGAAPTPELRWARSGSATPPGAPAGAVRPGAGHRRRARARPVPTATAALPAMRPHPELARPGPVARAGPRVSSPAGQPPAARHDPGTVLAGRAAHATAEDTDAAGPNAVPPCGHC